MTSESSHNQVNLARLLRRLEKAVDSQEWSYQTLTERSAAWVRAEGMLQVRIVIFVRGGSIERILLECIIC